MNKYKQYENFPHYFLCVCGFVAHVMLLVAFVKDPLKCFRNSATYLVASLAVSDMSVTISFPVFNSVHLERNFRFVDFRFVPIMSSFLTIFSISVDRYLMVVHPFKHRSLINGKRMIVWIISIWIVGFGLGFTKKLVKEVTINRLFHAAVEIGLTFSTALIYASYHLRIFEKTVQISDNPGYLGKPKPRSSHIKRETILKNNNNSLFRGNYYPFTIYNSE